MDYIEIGAFAVLGLVVVLVLHAGVSLVSGPVERKRLERFALRQWLVITPDNGNVVIRYLATTRRWRGGLLYLVAVWEVCWLFISNSQANFDILSAFVGWFIGAVVAEWRVDSLARGPRSAASLRPRRIEDFVRRRTLALVGVVWLVVIGMGVTALVTRIGSDSGVAPPAAVLVLAAVAGAAITLVARRILQRPQPLAAPDLLEADNAIRCRSLYVLAGSAIAIGGYLFGASAGELAGRSEQASFHLVELIGYLVMPLTGLIVARTVRRTPSAAEAFQPLAA